MNHVYLFFKHEMLLAPVASGLKVTLTKCHRRYLGTHTRIYGDLNREIRVLKRDHPGIVARTVRDIRAISQKFLKRLRLLYLCTGHSRMATLSCFGHSFDYKSLFVMPKSDTYIGNLWCLVNS